MTDLETNLTPDAVARMERSMARLKVEGVPVIDHLPPIVGEAHTPGQNITEIAERAMALMVVAAKGEGIENAGT